MGRTRTRGRGGKRGASAAAIPSEPFGSILGIIDSDPDVKLPRAARDTGGHARGIEIHVPTDTLLHRGSGFMSVDMGSGGQGVDIEADTAIERPDRD